MILYDKQIKSEVCFWLYTEKTAVFPKKTTEQSIMPETVFITPMLNLSGKQKKEKFNPSRVSGTIRGY